MNKQPTFWIETNLHSVSLSIGKQVKKILQKTKWTIDKTNHDYLFIIGGDGTYVRFLRKYYGKQTKIVCINTGTVGFYSKFTYKNIKKLVNDTLDASNFIHPQILEININNKKIYNAMNEAVFQSLNTIKMHIHIDNILYEKYMGSGILISTRTGSTGQAKANGGAIIFPNVDAFELVELSPTNHTKHHTYNAPAILSSVSQVKLTNFASSQRCDLVIDGMRVRHIDPKDEIIISKVDATFGLCFSKDIKAYIEKLHHTFIDQ